MSNHSTSLPKWLMITFLVVSFIGFVDASYLTSKHYSHGEVACSIVEGCNVVTTSEYSLLFGIPVALLGALYYLTLFIASLWYFDTKNPLFTKYVPWVTVIGLLASVWFVYAQIVLLEAICQYCMLSALTSTILFVLGMKVVSINRKRVEK